MTLSGSTVLASYGYDGLGHRESKTLPGVMTTGAPRAEGGQRLTSWNGTALSSDTAGNLTAFGSQTFTWNDRGQLAATSAGGASFTYDGLGRRLSRTVGGVTTKYLYDGANVVQEQNASGAATANLLSGLGVDQVFSRQVVGGATSSLLTDALGSTIGLADPTGAVQTSYTYEPFGATTPSGATNTNSYQFAGRENDGATSLYFFRARYLSPTFGRFISEDPLGFPGGPDPNLYAYVGNRPTMFGDPFGLDPGNGCGFLGFGCVASVFSTIGRCFLYMEACATNIKIAILPVIADGLSLVVLGTGVAACLLFPPEGCVAAAMGPIPGGLAGLYGTYRLGRTVWFGPDREDIYLPRGPE